MRLTAGFLPDTLTDGCVIFGNAPPRLSRREGRFSCAGLDGLSMIGYDRDMNINIDKMRAKALQDRDATIEQANTKYDRLMESLADIEDMSEPERPRAENGWLAEQIDVFLVSQPSEFTTTDVVASIQQYFPDIDIQTGMVSAHLRKMEGAKIEVVDRGAGRRPTRYRRLDGATTEAGPSIDSAAEPAPA